MVRPWGSSHVESAVYVQNMAGDVRSHGRSEEQRGVYNFAYVAETAERNLFDEILRHFFSHSFAHANVNKAGAIALTMMP